MPPIVFVVDHREAGKTLASVLKKRYGLSWSQAKRLVERRHVRVGQQIEVDVARRLKVGKKVQLDAGTIEVREPASARRADKPAPKPPPAKAPRPRVTKPAGGEAGPPSPLVTGVEVVYSDDTVVVANKPAGLTTMRHREEADEFGPRGKRFLPKTLADILPGLLGTPDRRVIAVHRIDRDTSGLVVFARTPAAAESLTKQFRKHTVDRRYLALTRGTPHPGRIESVFVTDRGDGRRGSTRKTNPPDGKRAVTHVKVVEELGAFAAVESRLETGRTHQVRIHLGETGTPLCGEKVYDRPVNGRPAADGSGAERPMLHAARLGFTHPETGQPVAWDVKPPADFSALWAKLRDRV
ncbi:MAG: RluA family pseudouridine synthase [Gemmataceae bacterium]|nr:RluA family pseudouridine synthase [Gemmataceae bacterium]